MSNRKIFAGIAALILLTLGCGFSLRTPSFLRNNDGNTSPTAESLQLIPTSNSIASTVQPPRIVDAPTAGPTPTLVPQNDRSALDAQEQVMVNIYQRVNPAVVYISVSKAATQSDPGGTGTGSGFVIDKQGHIVTNNHVVSGADTVDVTFPDGATARAKIVGRDPYSDLAVIQVDIPADKLTPVELGDSSNLQPGQTVIAIGNPFGLAGTMTEGIISAIGRTLPEGGDSSNSSNALSGNFINPEIIQTDAAINPGNSGGPLLDSHGRVIGVNTAIRSTSTVIGGQPSNSGIGFAVPVNTIKRVVPALIANGTIHYPYLGITSRDGLKLSAIAARLNANVAQGVLVIDVVPGGPAAKAGLRGGNTQDTVNVEGAPVPLGGDIIIAFNGKPVKDYTDLITQLTESSKPGDTVTLTIIRNGKQQDVKVTVGERPQ
ncbi:MAG: trypsin-like peptidase domain-containing protein [Chloroflexi bacterium]|nr:trypsin-like peptidase domain-containing protein [Chloroflexota bacterium]MCL5275994.1 trypsin-like peptidase domain-containing protein [Chloroflexota bacterium]